MLRTVSLAAISALLLGAAAPAMAQSVAETNSRVVYIGDVDQGTEEGADIILDRIADASASVCRDDRFQGSVANVAATETGRCRVEATETAVADLDNGLVTARYYGLTPEVIVSDSEYDDSVEVKKPA